MADHGEIALRLLDPTWSTVRGTLRTFTRYPPHPVGRGIGPRFGASSGPVVADASVPASRLIPLWGRSEDGQQSGFEVWTRLAVRHADAAYRVEQFEPGTGEAEWTEIRGPQGGWAISADGVRDLTFGPPEPTWLANAGNLLGAYRLELGDEVAFAGRTTVRVVGRTRDGLPGAIAGSMPPLLGVHLGSRCEALVDVATGLVLRVAAFDGPELSSLAQFTEVAIDEDLADAVFVHTLGPGERLRTSEDDMIDELRMRGVDVSGIDPTDIGAVHRAWGDHQRDRGGARGWLVASPGPGAGPVVERPLAEIVAPLGPPPADPAAAREAIEELFARLPASAEDRAETIELGDRVEWGPPTRPHPMVGDQTVVFHLVDLAFVRDDEALVAFEIRLGGAGGGFPFRGRVVQRDDRWWLSYETWAHLQQLGGQPVPSLPGTGPGAAVDGGEA